MTTVRVDYHREGEQWWADSVDVPGWVAGADTLEETRKLVREGLPFLLKDDDVEIRESHRGAPVVVSSWSGVVTTTAYQQPYAVVTPLHGAPAELRRAVPGDGVPISA